MLNFDLVFSVTVIALMFGHTMEMKTEFLFFSVSVQTHFA